MAKKKLTGSGPLALLIYPPVYDFALYDLFLKPFGLLRVGNLLKASGYRVRIVNSLDYDDEETIRALGKPKRKSNGTGKLFRQIVEKPAVLKKGELYSLRRNFARYGILPWVVEREIKKEKPDIIFISSGMTYWYLGIKEVVDVCRKYYPNVPIVLGGIYATLCEKHARSTLDVDFVVRGSARPELDRILDSLGFPGLVGNVPLVPLLVEEVFKDAAVIMLNTGCPFRCRYCASFRMYNRFIGGSGDYTVTLVKRIHSLFGTTNFAFYDDALLFRKEEFFLPFVRRIVDEKLKLNFYLPNGIHLSYLNEDVAKLMFAAGFKDIRVGLESSSSVFHREQDGKLDITEFGEKIMLLKSVGFGGSQIGVYILAGLPGQYWEEVEETIRFVAPYGVRIYVAEYSPVPGTPMFEESVNLSQFPIGEEPLLQNNTLFPLRWKGFNFEDLNRLKDLARELSVKL